MPDHISAKTVGTSDWLELTKTTLEEWSSAMRESGERFATICGMKKMLEWCAYSWASPPKVNIDKHPFT